MFISRWLTRLSSIIRLLVSGAHGVLKENWIRLWIRWIRMTQLYFIHKLPGFLHRLSFHKFPLSDDKQCMEIRNPLSTAVGDKHWPNQPRAGEYTWRGTVNRWRTGRVDTELNHVQLRKRHHYVTRMDKNPTKTNRRNSFWKSTTRPQKLISETKKT